VKEVEGQESPRLLRPPVLRDPTEEHSTSTWLELFFDLCFVVAVAALARGLHDDPTFGGILRFLGLFVTVWWAWMGFTWYATGFDNDDVLYRVTLLAGMLCILWLAASIEGVLHGATISFVLAFVALQLLLSGLFVRARLAMKDERFSGARPLTTIYAVGDLIGAGVWLASLLVPTPARYGVWAVALIIEIVTPILAVRAAYKGETYMPRVFHPAHIPERYGLFTIIVLGESVLAVAAGTADTGWERAAVLTGVFGFVVAACIWWIYFNHVQSSGLELSARAAFNWSYAHLLVYSGIAAFGVGTQLAIEATARTTTWLAAAAPVGEGGGWSPGARTILAGGVAVYLLAISFIHWVNQNSLRDRVFLARLGTAAILAGLIVLGSTLAPLAFTGLLALAMLSLATFETLRASQVEPG
jgi:low temperature requirement protein LtrA